MFEIVAESEIFFAQARGVNRIGFGSLHILSAPPLSRQKKPNFTKGIDNE
jgi:hypothetical protein